MANEQQHRAAQRFTLSEFERFALSNRVNLSDGHARQPLSDTQRQIVVNAPSIYDLSVSTPQVEIERDFLASYFAFAGQHAVTAQNDILLTFSSSSAIKMAAQYLRLMGYTVLLIEPCFDNILHLLRTEGVHIEPIYEEEVLDSELLGRRLSPKHALWLVLPNNPTGFCPDRGDFLRVVSQASERRSTLVLDFCFRSYAHTLRQWDQYEVLTRSEVDFICFEDTGKTWSVADTKVGITVASERPSALLYTLHDQLLLNVSPFHLLLLTEFVKDTLRNGFDKTIGEAIERNRGCVHGIVDRGVAFHAARECRNVPMELLRLPASVDSIALWQSLRSRGVDVLPASNYFWSRPSEGDGLFRIPLARPNRDIELALPIIESTIMELSQQ